jgi:hypothetical protein
MKLSNSLGANSQSGTQEILNNFRNPKINYRVHKSHLLISTLRQMNQVYTTTCSFSQLKKNSMVWVCKRTTPTERPPVVGEVIANFLQIEGATWSTWRIPKPVFSIF